VRAVERAIDVLQCLAASERPMNIVELSRKVRLNRPTLYRLLHTLALNDMIRHVGDPIKYQLHHGVARLGEAWHRSLNLEEAANPLLTRLWNELDETVALFALSGGKKRCVLELVSNQALTFSRGTGYIDTLAVGASGNAILAFLPAPFAAELIAAIRNPGRGRLEHGLERVRKFGYAVSQNQVIEGAICIAAPYFGSSGQVAGSVAIFGPAFRFDKTRVTQCANSVKQVAQELSRSLGHAADKAPQDGVGKRS
jgi:DNA-binding IclR family transcriptional regulator